MRPEVTPPLSRTALASINTEVPSVNFHGPTVVPVINTIILALLLKYLGFLLDLLAGPTQQTDRLAHLDSLAETVEDSLDNSWLIK